MEFLDPTVSEFINKIESVELTTPKQTEIDYLTGKVAEIDQQLTILKIQCIEANSIEAIVHETGISCQETFMLLAGKRDRLVKYLDRLSFGEAGNGDGTK